MGRRRKKTRKIVRTRRTIPSIFQCPHCGSQTLTISVNRVKGKAVARCGHCGFYAEVDVPPIYQAVDVYGLIVDLYNKGTLNYTITPPEEEEHEVEEQG